MDLIISAIAHRTGSTLLQRIFNQRPKTLIWGEHSGNAMSGILSDYCLIRSKVLYSSSYSEDERNTFFNSSRDGKYWIANMTPEEKFVNQAILNSLKAFFNTLYSQYRWTHDMIGFKEVRYGKQELELFRECFPKAKIVLLIRNPIEIWNSFPKDWPMPVENLAELWNSRASYYFESTIKDKNNYLFRYEDIILRVPETLASLSELAKVSIADIQAVLNYRTESTHKDKPPEEYEIIKNQCDDFMGKFEYL